MSFVGFAQAEGWLNVIFQWVPSHGKESTAFEQRCGASEAALRSWNDAADGAAKLEQQLAAGRSMRPQWHARRRNALLWEVQALKVLVDAAALYESHVKALKEATAA